MFHDASPLRTALIGCTILIFSMGVGRFAFTPLLPMMQAEGLLSISSGGTLASAHFAGYAMGALLSVYLPAGPRLTLFASLAAIGLATIAMALSGSFGIWLFARWGAGLCSAFILVVVSTHFVKQLNALGRPDLQGWVFAGVGAGIALAGFATLWLMAEGAPSRTGWQLLGIATLAAALIVLFLPKDHSAANLPAKGAGPRSSTPLAWKLVLPYGAMGAGYIIPATYLPVMAKQAISSPLIFGWGWPLFGIAAIVSTLVSAKLHARFSNRQVWAASQLVMAAGLLLPALWPNLASIMLGGICVGGTFMVITMAGMREAHQIAGPGRAQHLIAALTASFAAGQIAGPLLAGWAYGATGSFSSPLIFASLLLIATIIPMLTGAGGAQRMKVFT